MLKPTTPEKKLFTQIAEMAARFANERLQERGMIPDSGTFIGRWTMDRNRQPTISLEPHALYADYPFPDGIEPILNKAIQDAVDTMMEEFITLQVQKMYSTPDFKPHTSREVDENQLRLF